MRRSQAILFGEDTLKLELLTTPICRLPIKWEGSLFERLVGRVERELKRAGIDLRPHFYLSNEYGCVEGTANIGVGFWDVDPMLRDLNEEARGFRYSEEEILMTLRHEVGHAFCYSHKLYRLREFRSIFNVEGHFFRTYPSRNLFHFNPWSRDFVNPCGDHYAQKHPDDDFAETFAVWLGDPTWRRTYQFYPGALRKLEYVGQVVSRYGSRRPIVKNDPFEVHDPIDELKLTVKEFLGARVRHYRKRARGFIDPYLKRIFRVRSRRQTRVIEVPELVLRHKRMLTSRVSREIGVREAVVQNLIEKIRERASVLDLVVPRHLAGAKLGELSTLMETLTENYTKNGVFHPLLN